MFKLSHKRRLLRSLTLASCIVAIIICAFNLIIKHGNQNDSFAATEDGETVTVYAEYNDEQHFTNFSINNGSEVVQAYCAQTSIPGPAPNTTWEADLIDINSAQYNRMKLLMYINQYAGSNEHATAARSVIFGGWPGYSDTTAWYVKNTHYMLSITYSNDWAYIEDDVIPYINAALATLDGYINDGADVWNIAKNYQIYRVQPGVDYQDIVWIEAADEYNEILVQKCDSTIGTCSTTNPNLAGITFSIYNDSNTRIYNPRLNKFYSHGDLIESKTTNSSGQVSFANLLAMNTKYKIVETSTNDYFDLTASPQTVTLSASDISPTLYFYNDENLGKITVNKVDKDTGTCTTQGNATFNQTTFELTNSSANPIYYNGQIVASGAVVATKTLTNNACNATFDNLPYGSYSIKETAAGAGYTRNTTTKTVTIPTNNNTNLTISFDNTPILGQITVNKIDKDTGTCATTGNLSFDGTTFSITNDSSNAIYYSGRSYANGAVIDTKSLSNGACSVTFTNLPYGRYIIKETRASEGYQRTTTAKTVTIPTDSSVNISTTIENQAIRGDVKFIKKDSSNQNPMPNTLFSISAIDSSSNVIERHLVVSNANGIVDTSSNFIPHSRNTNGYDTLYDGSTPLVFSGFGTWFGLDHNGYNVPVNDDLGALPYGTYVIQELECNANRFCYDVENQKVTITINSANQVINLGDWNNTCTIFSLETVATDAKDGDKFVEVSEEASIKDKIKYCATSHLDFIIKGIIIDKSTGEPLLVNEKTVEQSASLNSETECGELEITFNLDTSELGGKEIVIYEYLYYDDQLIISHEDINDESQTVSIISLQTYASNKATGKKILPYDEEAEVNDEVKYCLTPDIEYTITGTIMDKSTGEKLLINNEPLEESITFTPTEACSSLNMSYQFNTANLADAQLVIFVDLYLDEQLLLSHHDFDDEDESFTVDVAPPETGYISSNLQNSTSTNSPIFFTVATSAFGLITYQTSRILRKKNFLKRK